MQLALKQVMPLLPEIQQHLPSIKDECEMVSSDSISALQKIETLVKELDKAFDADGFYRKA